MTNHNDPLDQLAAFRTEVDGPTREAHLDAIEEALTDRPARRRMRWPLAAVVAALIAGPVTAIASESAVPGDLLYPVKLVVEPALRIFDHDVVVDHRVDEVRVLIDRRSDDARIAESIDVARSELAVTDAPASSLELDRLVSDWMSGRDSTDGASRDDEDPPTDEPVRQQGGAPSATTPREADRSIPADSSTRDGSSTTTRTSTATSTSTTAPLNRPRDGDGSGDRPAP